MGSTRGRIGLYLNTFSRRAFYTTVLLILGIDLIVFMLYGGMRSFLEKNRQPNFQDYSIGMYLSRKDVLNRAGISVTNADQKTLLLLFIDPGLQWVARELSFIDLLSQKYNASGLITIGIMRSQHDQVRYYAERLNLTFPLISDSNQLVSGLVNARVDRSGVILIDARDTIRAITPFLLDENNLRQIVESHFLGHNNIVNSKEELMNQIMISEDLGGLVLADPSARNNIKLLDILSGRPAILTFVDPFCNFCNEESLRIQTLNKLLLKLTPKFRVVLIHKSSADYHEVESFVESQHFIGDSYLTSEKVLKTNEYVTDTFRKQLVTSLIVDGKGTVRYVESMDDDEREFYDKTLSILSSLNKLEN